MPLYFRRTIQQPKVYSDSAANLCRLCGKVGNLGYARRRGVLTAQVQARILMNCVFRRGMLTPRFKPLHKYEAGIIREGVRFAYY